MTSRVTGTTIAPRQVSPRRGGPSRAAVRGAPRPRRRRWRRARWCGWSCTARRTRGAERRAGRPRLGGAVDPGANGLGVAAAPAPTGSAPRPTSIPTLNVLASLQLRDVEHHRLPVWHSWAHAREGDRRPLERFPERGLPPDPCIPNIARPSACPYRYSPVRTIGVRRSATRAHRREHLRWPRRRPRSWPQGPPAPEDRCRAGRPGPAALRRRGRKGSADRRPVFGVPRTTVYGQPRPVEQGQATHPSLLLHPSRLVPQPRAPRRHANRATGVRKLSCRNG